MRGKTAAQRKNFRGSLKSVLQLLHHPLFPSSPHWFSSEQQRGVERETKNGDRERERECVETETKHSFEAIQDWGQKKSVEDLQSAAPVQ